MNKIYEILNAVDQLAQPVYYAVEYEKVLIEIGVLFTIPSFTKIYNLRG